MADSQESARPSRRIQVEVDLTRCQGYAQCVFAVPQVFRLQGEEALEFDPAPEGVTYEHLLRAVKACPVQAVTVGFQEAES
jgi:ferredoxin